MGTKRKKFNEKQLTVISALVAGGIFVLLVGGIFLEYGHASTLTEEIDASKSLRADLRRKESQIPQLREEIKSLELDVERMARILPNDQEIADLVKNLDKIVEGTREGDEAIKVTVFRPDEEKKAVSSRKKKVVTEDSAFTLHPYMIQAQGNFYQLGRFINQLENHIRFINARSFMIALPKDKRLRDVSRKFVTIKIITYTYNNGKDRALETDDEKRDVPEEVFKNQGFDFVRRGRRDPLKMPLSLLGQGDSILKNSLTSEQQSTLLAQAEQMLLELKEQIAMKLTQPALKNYIGIEEIYSKRFTKQQYFVRIGEIYAEAKRSIGEIKEAATLHAIMRSESAIKNMQLMFEIADYEGMVKMNERIKRELDGVKDFDEQYREQINRLVAESEKLAQSAAIRLEVRDAGVKITGFVRMNKSIAILEGSIYVQAGMVIEVGGIKFEVYEVDVDREVIVLGYKGEHIEIKGPAPRPPILSQPRKDEPLPDEDDSDKDSQKDNENPGGDAPTQPGGLGKPT